MNSEAGERAGAGDRQRWDDLLAMAADLAFETDRWGRLVFLAPDDVLGWPARTLLGKPAELLLAAPGSIAGFNPFRAATRVRGRRAWLNRPTGGHVCLRFNCSPVLNGAGVPVGTRGIGMLEPDGDTLPAPLAAHLAAPGAAPVAPPLAEPAIDRLTGLPNRHAFLAQLARQIGRLDRDRVPSTMMCADLDHFRALNDVLGPALGDQVLVTVAALLAATLRPTDLIGRLGGDMFAMWLSGADHMTAAERAESLRLAVPEAVASIMPTDAPIVGVSIGIAARHLDGGETVEMLLRRAERAMHAVKRGGRGHWRVAHLTEP